MYYLIYLEHALLLSRHPYQNWQEIQAEFSDYKTSLGHWSLEDVLEFMATEYRDSGQEIRIRSFADSSAVVMSLYSGFQS